MEASLVGGKLQKKQVQELSKQLHSLKSNTAPLVKKRQIMRNTLGDYREKMAEDERKFSKTVSVVKFTGSTSLEKKSIFVKKAAGCSTQNSNRQTDDRRTQNTLQSTEQAVCNKTESPFKFNF
ncbi:U488 protein, partial [Acromyrmex charruanus]